MPRYYFHLSAPDQLFRDDIGSDAGDLAAVHSRAVLLADRVMGSPLLTDHVPSFARWIVAVTDATQRPVLNLIFPANLMASNCKPLPASDARTLLLALDATLSASRQR